MFREVKDRFKGGRNERNQLKQHCPFRLSFSSDIAYLEDNSKKIKIMSQKCTFPPVAIETLPKLDTKPWNNKYL